MNGNTLEPCPFLVTGVDVSADRFSYDIEWFPRLIKPTLTRQQHQAITMGKFKQERPTGVKG